MREVIPLLRRFIFGISSFTGRYMEVKNIVGATVQQPEGF